MPCYKSFSMLLSIPVTVVCVLHRLLRQVLNETLRLSVLAPFAARYSDDDIVAGGYSIPAGTPIVISLGVSLKNETLWKNTEKYCNIYWNRTCLLDS